MTETRFDVYTGVEYPQPILRDVLECELNAWCNRNGFDVPEYTESDSYNGSVRVFVELPYSNNNFSF